MSSSSSARISISSDEVNLLVYRYLIESGFKHTAFVFHGESLLHRSPNLVQTDMPPGSLVTLIQKSLLFLYAETHIANDGSTIKCDEPFSLFKPHDHDHGPIQSGIQFEAGHLNHRDNRRTEGSEGVGRPSKKARSKAKASSESQVDQSETISASEARADLPEEEAEPKPQTDETKIESMEVDTQVNPSDDANTGEKPSTVDESEGSKSESIEAPNDQPAAPREEVADQAVPKPGNSEQ